MDESLNPSCSSDDEDSLYEEEEAETDEEKFEVMKDVLYKAGEMDSDGLDEWQPGSSKKKSSKSTKKITPKSSGTESPPPIPEIKKRRPQLSATLVVQPVPLNGFRIPKKNNNNSSPIPDEGLASRWTDSENSASQALLSLFAVKKEDEKFTAIKRHPPTLIRYGPPASEAQRIRRNSFSPPPLTVATCSKTVPALSVAIKVEQPDCIQERRSRKQKMPKSNKAAQAVTSFTSERL